MAGQRFQFAKFAGSSYKSSEMGDAFRILEKTLLLELVYPLISTSFPILPDLKRSPKLLWLDTGLVNYVAEMQERLLFTSATDELWNGDIAEQVVGQELLGASVTFGTKRMFWVRDARNSQAEVDFVYKFKSRFITDRSEKREIIPDCALCINLWKSRKRILPYVCGTERFARMKYGYLPGNNIRCITFHFIMQDSLKVS